MVATVSGSRTARLKWIAIFYCLVASILSNAECKKAQAEDVPNGANELVELPQKNLSYVHGRVRYLGNHHPANDIVIEIYRQSGTQSFEETRKQPRITACITGEDGKFSFTGLKPGRYLLLAGTRKFAGMNETCMFFTVKERWWWKNRSGLKIALSVGT